MSEQEPTHARERDIEALKGDNARLRSQLLQAQEFCIAKEKKSIEYIFHIGQFKSRLSLRLENAIMNLLGLGQSMDVPGLKEATSPPSYADWVERYDSLTPNMRAKINAHISRFSKSYKFSLIIFAQTVTRERLEATLSSLVGQLYQNWELIVLDDNQFSKLSHAQLSPAYQQEGRLRFIQAQKTCAVTQFIPVIDCDILGDFVGMITPGDTLSSHALYEFAAELDLYPQLSCLYCDEDALDPEGKRISPCFKPDWNLTLFLAQNYVGSLCLLKKDHFVATQTRFIEKFSGSDDARVEALYFYALTTASREAIGHLAAALYHRAALDCEDNALAWMRRSLGLVQAYHDVHAPTARATQLATHPDWIETRYDLMAEAPLVTLIIPTRNRPDLLGACLEGVLSKTNYPNIEVIVVDHENDHPGAIKLFKDLAADPRVSIMPYRGVFDHSRMNNKAAEIARGDILLFLNDDIEVIDPDWLLELASQCLREDCGVVGARLLYPNGRIQHAGVILGFGGVAGHGHVGLAADDPGYFGRLLVASEVSALTGACMAMRRALFEEVGGFSARNLQRTFNDVDLCLKARAKGKVNIFTPRATLIHRESATDGGDIKLTQYARLQREAGYMLETWGLMRADPCYNVNLSLEGRSFELAYPPRRVWPWEAAAQA